MNRLPAYMSGPASYGLGLVGSGVDLGVLSRLTAVPLLRVRRILIASGDDLVALFKAAEDLDVCGSGDAGGDGNEDRRAVSLVGS